MQGEGEGCRVLGGDEGKSAGGVRGEGYRVLGGGGDEG